MPASSQYVYLNRKRSSLPYYQYGFRTNVQSVLSSQCQSPIPADRTRIDVGVGEQVDLSFSANLGVTILWSTTAGSISANPTIPRAYTLTAPDRATNLTVNATIGSETCSIGFNVVEPTGVNHAGVVELQFFQAGLSGAGMHLKPYLLPTNVSFCNVQLMEIGTDATSVQGYFTRFSTTYLSHKGPGRGKADSWFGIQPDNSWQADYDWAVSDPDGYPRPWSIGSFTWIIPAQWKVGNGATKNMPSGWQQVFSIDPSGTVTIQKFDRKVIRSINQPYGTYY